MTSAERAREIEPYSPKALRYQPWAWQGTAVEEGRYATDGHTLIDTAKLTEKNLERIRALEERNRSDRDPIKNSRAKKLYEDILKKDTVPTEILGVRRDARRFYMVAQFDGEERLILADTDKIKMFDSLVGFDEIRAFDCHQPLVMYRKSEPVGLIMPMRLLDEMGEIDISVARRSIK